MSAQHSVANRTRDVATVATVGVVLALLVFPFVWVVVTSVRPAEELLQSELRLFPDGVNLDGYSELLTSGFVRYLLNSLAVCATAAAVSVALALLAAYSFSRRSFRGRSVLLLLVVFSQVFPFIVLVPSVYAAFVRLELVNTYAGLVIAYIAITVPFSVYLLLGYLDSVPTELDDAAKVDGCSTPRLIRSVIFPVIRPGVVITATYAFVVAWEEYLFAAALMTDREKWTAPVGLAAFLGEFSSRWDLVMAASVLTTLPTLAIFLVLQRGLVSGLVAGSGK